MKAEREPRIAPSPDAVREAMAWLAHVKASNLNGPQEHIHARTIQALLAEPRMPAEMPPGLEGAIRETWVRLNGNAALNAYNAIREHLSKPATRMVERWPIRWAERRGDGSWMARECTYANHADAEAKRRLIEHNPSFACVTVGPMYTQEVPV